MSMRYEVAEIERMLSPSLVIFRDLVEQNLKKMVAIAGDVARLRPHVKTHKMPAMVQLEMAHGITKHKCATLAEAEMLAECGVRDIFLAYNLVGPNIERGVKFRQKYPEVELMVTVDHEKPLRELGEAMTAAGTSIGVLLDMDTGQHRTGLEVGGRGKELYGAIARTKGVRAAGLHVYDGHQHQKDLAERRTAVLGQFEKVVAFRDELRASGYDVPRMVCGGTASFPIYAEQADPTIELSPGTCVFHDAGYGESFPDLDFVPAACVLTRVVSRPTEDRVTFDLGYKAAASDPPAGRRLVFPNLPDAEQVLQNEEHLVIKTAQAGKYQPGDTEWAIPRHICPSVALHKWAYVVSEGHLCDTWEIVARDRQLTV